MSSENKLQGVVEKTLKEIKNIIGADTVIGQPIEANGTAIIPISKVSVGVATGGIDYNSKSETPSRQQNFGGGGGTGLTVVPVGFLIIDAEGEVEFINVGNKGKPDPVDQIADLVERTPDIISKIKNIFSKEPKETV